jgi:hypothetical protein
MNDVSVRLSKFIKSINIKNTKEPATQLFSPKSLLFLEKIYTQIINADNEWLNYSINNNSIIENPHNIKETIIEFSKGNSYNYLPTEIKTLISNSIKRGRLYEFKIGTQLISVHIILPFSKKYFSKNKRENKINSTKMNAFFSKCLHKIFLWMYIGNKYKPIECSQQISIYLYFTEHFKLLPELTLQNIKPSNIEHSRHLLPNLLDDKHTHHNTRPDEPFTESIAQLQHSHNPNTPPITQINSNTAATTACQNTTEIHLYREEEWFKVLIHETFHCLGLDFSGEDSTYCNSEMRKIFPVKSDVRLSETYCEMWAEIFNVLFFIYFSNKKSGVLENKHHNNGSFSKKLNELIYEEQCFSRFQSVKVLNYFNLTYKELYDTTHSAQIKRNSHYKEETHILSYYIIKSIMMSNINKYIEWVIDNNNGSLVFIKTQSNMEKYCLFVRENYNNPEYIENIENLEDWFSINKNNKGEELEFQTLRMALTDF